MFVRTTEMQGDPARTDEGLAMVRDEIFPAVTEMDGCVGMSLLVSRETGRSIATTAWESEEAMQASAPRVKPFRDRAEESLGSNQSEVHQWEVAAVHRDHHIPEGACARLTWLTGDPATAEHAVETYRTAVLPRLREMQGFCSASFMIDRETGRAVGTVVFDTRDALTATADAAQTLRERVAGELGATVDRVDEMEVLLAHLHVPEMA